MRASNLLALMLLTPAAAGAQIHIRPGQYEYTLEMDLGVPREGAAAVLDAAGVKGQKKLECLKQEVKSADDVVKLFSQEEEMENCTISDVRTTGRTMTYTMRCEEDDVRVTMHTEMTFGADSFTTVTKGKDNEGRATSMKITARRLGDCPK